ncbi:hypothetical protein ABMA28_017036 [Loxostege sticticalis]|uniref:Protein kinase domain-containing protein n=1 Tax=Loxostege sticticalis TaxID=481309 RepID=A0ABD0T6V0_LOXSC
MRVLQLFNGIQGLAQDLLSGCAIGLHLGSASGCDPPNLAGRPVSGGEREQSPPLHSERRAGSRAAPSRVSGTPPCPTGAIAPVVRRLGAVVQALPPTCDCRHPEPQLADAAHDCGDSCCRKPRCLPEVSSAGRDEGIVSVTDRAVWIQGPPRLAPRLCPGCHTYIFLTLKVYCIYLDTSCCLRLRPRRLLFLNRPRGTIQSLPYWTAALLLDHLKSNEVPNRGAVEQSPLYVQKEFETDEEFGDEWEVSRSRVHLGGLIGSGAFGQVHAAQLDMPGGETITVAAKMLAENATEEEMQDFLGEIVMLKHVGSHKHVIRLIACCTRRAPLIALLEHAPRGDLLTLLRAARGRRREQGSSVTRRVNSDVHGRPSEADTEYTNLSDSDPALSDGKLYIEEETLKSRDHYVAEPALQLDSSTMREYALQVALGMKHLEERGITHRDLAARNILVDAAGVLKVADFGLSRSGVYVHTRSRPVPLRWLAPEAILLSQYCSASDVWAFAVLLWEIATLGGFPYSELSNHQVPPFLAGGGRLPKPARASPRLYELMVECWAEEPQDRPTFSSIVEKLSIQKQLYVDLDSLLASEEVSTFDDFEFSESEEVR